MTPVQEILKAFYDGKLQLSDETIDGLLGIPSPEHESRQVLEQGYCISKKGEQSTYDGASYDALRAVLHFANPQESDVIYDLGAGYGRLLLFGAMTTRSFYNGCEIVPLRAKIAQEAVQRNGLEDRAVMTCANVRDVNYDDGSIFFLYNPFSIRTLNIVGNKLKKIAKHRPIMIASVGFCSIYFNKQDWLSPIMRDDKNFLTVYRPLQD